MTVIVWVIYYNGNNSINETVSSDLKLEKLEILELGMNHFHKINKNTFVSLPEVKNISLPDNRIQSIDEESFRG